MNKNLHAHFVPSAKLVLAMQSKYLKELEELCQKPKLEARDLPRLRELRKVLAAIKDVK